MLTQLIKSDRKINEHDIKEYLKYQKTGKAPDFTKYFTSVKKSWNQQNEKLKTVSTHNYKVNLSPTRAATPDS